jgi:hypothetical protein
MSFRPKGEIFLGSLAFARDDGRGLSPLRLGAFAGDIPISFFAFFAAIFCASSSDPQDVENHGKNAAGDNDGDDPGDHSRCRRIPDGGRAVTALESP